MRGSSAASPPMNRHLDTLLDAAALMVTKATFIGLRLAVLYLCAARISRAEFGLLALSFTVAEVSRFIGDWGTDTLSLRHFSHPDGRQAATDFRWVLRTRWLSCVVAGACALGGILVLVGLPFGITAMIVSLTSVSSLWLNLGINWLQARASLRPAAAILSAVGLACLGVQILASTQGWEVGTQLLALLGFEVIMAVIVLTLARRQAAGLAPTQTGARQSAPTLGKWLHHASPIALASLLALAYGRFDQFYIRHYAAAETLGDYTLANRVVEPLLFVAAALYSTIYARASTIVQHRADRTNLRHDILRWGRFMLAYALTAAVVAGGLAGLLLPRVFPSYTEALPYLWIALAALVFRCLNLCCTAFIQALGHYRLMLGVSIWNFCAILTLVFVLGSYWGAVGAAWAVAIGEILNTVIQTTSLQRLIRKVQPS